MRTKETEKMMDDLIVNIVNAMAEVLSEDQIKKLKNVLYMQMNEYNIEKRCTSVIPYDDSNNKILELFLSTKSIEGKSENTIIRYRDILSMMLKGINKSIKNISTWDLRTYLALYKETRHISFMNMLIY